MDKDTIIRRSVAEMGKPFEIDELWTDRIIQSVNGLEFGTVQIVIHDGRIVQIERMERRRFDSEKAADRPINTPQGKEKNK